MIKRISAIVLGLTLGLSANGQQDRHSSFFFENPVFLNPGAAGFHSGHLQFYSSFRMQWMTASDKPWMTSSAALDWRMFDQGNGFLGAGLQFYNDMAGTSKFTTNWVSVPINYAIQFNEENHLSIGLQPAWYSRSMDYSGVTWDSQWTGIDFNTDWNSGENGFLNQNLTVNRFDMAAGIYWYANLSDEVRLSFGASGHHLTKQRVNFFGPEDKLWRKFAVHGQGEFRKRNSPVSVLPAFAFWWQGPNKEVVLGTNFKFQLRSASLHTGHFEDITFSLGPYYRIGDAILFNMILDISGFAIGANYDLNVSGLTTATSGVGAMEFFLRWRMRFGGRNLANPQIH